MLLQASADKSRLDGGPRQASRGGRRHSTGAKEQRLRTSHCRQCKVSLCPILGCSELNRLLPMMHQPMLGGCIVRKRKLLTNEAWPAEQGEAEQTCRLPVRGSATVLPSAATPASGQGWRAAAGCGASRRAVSSGR